MKQNTLFGQKLTFCREFLGFSKKDMAGAMGVSPSTYSKFEKGISMPSVHSLHIVSIISEVSMEEFVDEDSSLEDFIYEITTPLDQRFIEVLEDIIEETNNKKTGG
ncbi:MAG: helix-turn-helix domain-containing protein [Eubacterium sp.]|nr:helix-turn-helix domain-containing protein [Eubacterium sp.]